MGQPHDLHENMDGIFPWPNPLKYLWITRYHLGGFSLWDYGFLPYNRYTTSLRIPSPTSMLTMENPINRQRKSWTWLRPVSGGDPVGGWWCFFSPVDVSMVWTCSVWLVVWTIFYFPTYWECHHPNWLTHIFQRGGPTTNQLIFYGHFPIGFSMMMVILRIQWIKLGSHR